MTPVPEGPLSSSPLIARTSEPCGVLIADDHVLFNDGIRLLLASEPALQVLHQVYTGSEIEPAVLRYKPVVILLDINLPDVDGLQLSERLKKVHPTLKIILLSMYNDRQFVQRAQALRIEGYLLKTATQNELSESILAVCSGETRYLTNKGSNIHHDKDSFISKYKLTPREIEIIRLIKAGKSSSQIAESIYLSVYTVETHRRNINLKLGIKNPVELVQKANEMGL